MKTNINAVEIIETLSAIKLDGYSRKRYVLKYATNKQLIEALSIADTDLLRQIICEILGTKKAKTAVPSLVALLNDSSPGVRDEAADALSKIGDVRAGSALMRQLDVETDPGIKRTIIVALGSVKCKPSIPILMNVLQDTTDGSMRGSAAWSLGYLKAKEAVSLLKQILSYETDLYAKEHIKVALQEIETT